MLRGLQTSFSNFLHTVFRSLKFTDRPEGMAVHEIQPSATVLQAYEHYNSLCSDLHVYRDRMNNLKVDKIRHYKELEDVGHEFLVAHIIGGRSQYARLERSVGPKTNTPEPPKESEPDSEPSFDADNSLRDFSTPCSPPSWPLSTPSEVTQTAGKFTGLPLRLVSSRASDLKFGAHYASDSVTYLEYWPNCGRNRVKVGEFRFEKITLLDFLLVAKAANKDSPLYQVLRRQCFWLADTVVQVLAKVEGKVVVEGEGNFRFLEYAEGTGPTTKETTLEEDYDKDVKVKAKSGRWGLLPIQVAQVHVTEIVHTEYEKTKVEFMKDVKAGKDRFEARNNEVIENELKGRTAHLEDIAKKEREEKERERAEKEKEQAKIRVLMARIEELERGSGAPEGHSLT